MSKFNFVHVGFLRKEVVVFEEARCVCGDCGAEPGELHAMECDLEVCPCCGGQLISCGCRGVFHPTWKQNSDDGRWFPPDAARIPWTGIVYDEAKKVAESDNKFTRYDDVHGWVSCSADHPEAGPDVNYGAHKMKKRCPFWE